MAIIFRLSNRQFLNHLIRNEPIKMLSAVRPIVMKAQPAQPEQNVGYAEKNMNLGRPQSPHLRIYAPQLTWLLSITHRFTGIAVTAYAVAFGLGAILLPESIPHYIDALAAAKVGRGTICAGKFVLAFPMTYHFWNGIRHLVWDTGMCLTIREVYITGYAMLGASIVSAIALSVM